MNKNDEFLDLLRNSNENSLEIGKIYHILEKDIFAFEKVSNLEKFGFFEKGFWPNFSEKTKDVKELLVIIMAVVNFKVSQKINVWEFFRKEVPKFNLFFEVSSK